MQTLHVVGCVMNWDTHFSSSQEKKPKRGGNEKSSGTSNVKTGPTEVNRVVIEAVCHPGTTLIGARSARDIP